MFQCHQPITEEARVLVSDPLLNCSHDFFVGPEMTSTDIFFKFGNRKKSRGISALARTDSAQRHPLQYCKCGLMHCPVGAESLWRVYLSVFHRSQFSAGRALFFARKSNIIMPCASQNTVAITLPAEGCVLNFFGLGDPGPTHWRL